MKKSHVQTNSLWLLLAVVSVGGLAAHAGHALNYLLPALFFAVALIFARSSPAHYVRLLIVALVLAPFLRRLADYYGGGFTDPSPMLLIPYVVPLASLRCIRLRELTQRHLLPFTLALIAITYGLLVGLVSVQEHTASLVPALRWACPALAGIYIAQVRDRTEAVDALLSTIRWAILASALYAIVQIAILPGWDMLWLKTLLETGQGNSYGRPAPFAFRAFGTLNSGGVAAEIWGVGALAWLFYKGRGRAPALAILFVAIFLTLVRTEWLCLPVAMIAGLLLGRTRSALTALGGAVAILLLSASLLAGAIPEVRNSIADRVSTMGDSGRDESLIARSLAIRAALDMASDIPFGKGLGFLDGPAYGRTPMANPSNASSADLGIIGMLFDLGYLGAAVYLAGLVLLSLSIWRMPPGEVGTLVKATLVLTLLHVWSNNPFVAPSSLLLWTLGALSCSPALNATLKHKTQARTEVHA
jgi:hypothetical protein